MRWLYGEEGSYTPGREDLPAMRRGASIVLWSVLGVFVAVALVLPVSGLGV